MDNEAYHDVKISFGRCLVNGDLIQKFYEHFLDSDPRLPFMFENTNFSEQRELLSHSINLVILFAGGSENGKQGLSKVRKSHSKKELNIPPEMYPLWINSFLETVKEMDEKLDEKVLGEWEEVLNIAVDYIKSGYDE